VAPAGVTGDVDKVDAAMKQRAQANLMLVTADDMQKQLAKMKADLAAMESVAADKTTVNAYPTGQSWDGAEIWECTGFAVKP
jgi:hypothetical protein